MNSNDPPDRELTPETAEMRRALAEVTNWVRDAESRADEHIDRLAELVESFVANPTRTNYKTDNAN